MRVKAKQSKTLYTFTPLNKMVRKMQSNKQLIQFLKSESKHGNYQYLPPKLVEVYPELEELNVNNMRLDDKRYEYFTQKLSFQNKRVTDIGANIGYFSFRLATEFNSHVTTYEPNSAHYQAINAISSILSLNTSQITNINEGIDFNAIDKLSETDILLFFNVIQHAGEDYDAAMVPTVSDWYKYAVAFLTKLRSKTQYMVFQSGYSWLGHKEDLCAKKEIIKFSVKLLKDAGWDVQHCGVVQNYQTCNYQDVDITHTQTHPILTPIKFFEYGVKYRLGFKMPNYRFIQRPIFICKA
jgi:hypothetical protein